jgi:hypothetical protein
MMSTEMKNTQPVRKTRGQSLLEMAISLVVVLMLLAGVVDFGFAFFSWVAIRDASQEGAIFGAVAPVGAGGANPNPAIFTRVRGVSTSPVNLADTTRVRIFVGPTVNEASPASSPLGCPGTPVTVLIEYDYISITPGLSGFIGNDGVITVRASTTNTILTTTRTGCP